MNLLFTYICVNRIQINSDPRSTFCYIYSLLTTFEGHGHRDVYHNLREVGFLMLRIIRRQIFNLISEFLSAIYSVT